MIWLILGIIILSCLLFLVGPLLKPAQELVQDAREIETYTAEFSRLDAEFEVSQDPKEEAKKIDLQRQLLALTKKQSTRPPLPMNLIINGLFVVFIFGGLGLYSALGSPDLTRQGVLQAPTLAAPQALSQNTEPQHENNMSLEALVSQLEEKLKSERKDDPDGWMLYARSLMNLGRFNEAFSAYEKVLSLTDNSPEVASELERARAFAAQRLSTSTASQMPPNMPRGPSAQDIEAASQMNADDRQAMIEGMVTNLAARLSEKPNDPEGWARLMRVRSVLGQTDQLNTDIETVKTVFKDTPELRDRILSQVSLPE